MIALDQFGTQIIKSTTMGKTFISGFRVNFILWVKPGWNLGVYNNNLVFEIDSDVFVNLTI